MLAIPLHGNEAAAEDMDDADDSNEADVSMMSEERPKQQSTPRWPQSMTVPK